MTRTRPWLINTGFIVGFAALMAMCARIDVPMHPVPMSMQSWAVILAGSTLGVRWGVLATGLYLLAALVGLPVLSGGASGPEALTGATAGYIAGFPLAAALAGLWATDSRRPIRVFSVALAAHAVILTLGAAWLSRGIGLQAAVNGGVTPFLIGMSVKSLLVLAGLGLLRRLGVRPG